MPAGDGLLSCIVFQQPLQSSSAELKAVTDRIETSLSPALKARVGLFEVPDYEPIEGLPDIRQVFVTTDVFTIGTAAFEQAIELQVDRARP